MINLGKAMGNARVATTGELRVRAADLHRQQISGRPVRTPRRDAYAVDIPAGPGLVLSVEWCPSTARLSQLFLQIVRTGPGGERTAASGSLRVDSGSMPGLAEALADCLDLAAERASGDDERSQHEPGTPNETERR